MCLFVGGSGKARVEGCGRCYNKGRGSRGGFRETTWFVGESWNLWLVTGRQETFNGFDGINVSVSPPGGNLGTKELLVLGKVSSCPTKGLGTAAANKHQDGKES